MAVNGEAIYGTRPWKVYGEGAQGPKVGNFNEDKLQYTAEDIRFTVKGTSLFVFALAWPSSGSLLVRSLASTSIQSAHLLNGGEALQWKRQADGLAIALPRQPRGDHAFVLRVQLGA